LHVSAHHVSQQESAVTEQREDREPGSTIGQRPDENTEEVRDQLGPGDERVAVTNTQAGEPIPDDAWPHGHREGDRAGDDDVREAGRDG